MLDLIDCAVDFQTFLESRDTNFAFIGGVANLAWGAARFTHDVDLTVFTGFIDEIAFIDDVLASYRGRFEDAASFALKARVLLLIGKNNIPIDVGLAGFPYEEQALSRATYKQFSGNDELRVISAEDLILMKAFAGRLHDWADIEKVVERQGGGLNRGLILELAPELAELKDDPELVRRLHKALGP
jgi:predicted nucleotidyltransferase